MKKNNNFSGVLRKADYGNTKGLMKSMGKKGDHYIEITQKAIAKYRENLLDISNRNNLINLNFNPRSNKVIRIIDELPNNIFNKLNDEADKKLQLIALPPSEKEPKDEKTEIFKKTFEEFKTINETYLKSIENLGDNFDEANKESQIIIRQLKDEVRVELKLAKRISSETMSIEEYAKAHGIDPKYEVPKQSVDKNQSKHEDSKLQTLFYSEDLERKGRILRKDTKRILDEKGTNTLHLSYGCIEWNESGGVKRYSPLLLTQVQLSEESSDGGAKYFIQSTQGETFLNLPLSRKLLNDFNLTLPVLESDETPEAYFKKIEKTVLQSKPDWKLRRYITLAIHTYSKMSMYEELDPEKWMAEGNILGNQENIKTLFTGSSHESSLGEIYDVDDKKIFSKVPIVVEETDSSQFSAIADAMSGRNLAIQGPPGTGKSTTITNMIASFLYNKKKVLFIAEKKAALDVVYKKLKDKGLDKFTFRLSSTAEKKTSIIEELKKRLETEQPLIQSNLHLAEEEYIEKKNKIRKYGKILETKYFEIQKSGYEILSTLSRYKFFLTSYPKFVNEDPFIDKVQELSKNQYIKNLSIISDINKIMQSLKKEFKDITKHPWYGLITTENNPYEITELKKYFLELKKRTENIIPKINDFFKELDIKNYINEKNLKSLIKIFTTAKVINREEEKKVIFNLNEKDVINSFKKFKVQLKKHNDFLVIKNDLAEEIEFDEKFEQKDLKRHLKNIKNSIFILSFFLNPEYRKSKTYFTYIVKNGKYQKDRAIKVLKDIIAFIPLNESNETTVKSLRKNYTNLEKALGSNFDGENTKYQSIDDLSKYLEFPDINDQLLINKNIYNIVSIKAKIQKLSESLSLFNKCFDEISKKIDCKKFFDFSNENKNFSNIPTKIDKINFEDDKIISDYIQLNFYNKNLNNDLQKLYDAFINENFDFKMLESSYKYLVYNSLAKKLFQKEKELSSFSSESWDLEVDHLKNLDKKVFENKKNILIDNLLDISIEPGIKRGKVGDLTEKALIEKEIGKQRAHIPFRQLMKRAGQALRDMKPCYMLSPISLSQIVNAEPEIFDVLIIDEASQMKIEDSIGAILRSKQTIIVGDPQQLPPTNFFNTTAEFDGDGIIDDDESILDLALSKYQPARMLKWHYRSKHESLINFSNYHFYNNNLIIPPSANDQFAIKNNYINGNYAARVKSESTTVNKRERGGVNLIESEEISKGVIKFMKDCIQNKNKKSCLVVTMNNTQRDIIDENIRFLSSKDQSVSEYIGMWEETMEPFIVKNLENVQGDERDYIFISTLFGPNKENITMQRFGPINHPKGHRRLNVLFTRAKHGVELYTSLTPNLIREGGEKGRKIFKSYLEYAKTERLETGNITERDTDSDFEDWVKEELEQLGYEVKPQVGVSGFKIDLGIKHKKYKYGFLAGIECDGATYHSSVSARDSDIVRQKVLESRGWNIYRIWSTDWFDNPHAELKKLDSYLKALLGELNKPN